MHDLHYMLFPVCLRDLFVIYTHLFMSQPPLKMPNSCLHKEWNMTRLLCLIMSSSFWSQFSGKFFFCFSVIWSVTNYNTTYTPELLNHTRGWFPLQLTAYHPQRPSLFLFLFVCLCVQVISLPPAQTCLSEMGVSSVMVLPLLVVVMAGIYYVYNEVIRFMSKSVVRNKVLVITDAVSGMGSGNTQIYFRLRFITDSFLLLY